MRSRLFTRRLALLVLAGLCLLPLAVGGSSASTRGFGDIRLHDVRDQLAALRGTVTTPEARQGLERAIASLGSGIASACWTYPMVGGGVDPANGSRCLEPMRTTVNRLVRSGPELRTASDAQVRAIVAVARDVAAALLAGLPGATDAERALVWKVQHDVTEGDGAGPQHALNAYIRAWRRVNGSGGPAPAITFGSESVQPKRDYNPAGQAEAFEFVAGGSTRNLGLYLDAGSSTTDLWVGVYTDANGSPGQLIPGPTMWYTTVLGAGDWNVVPVGTTLVPGERYWAAILSPAGGGTVRFRDRCCGARGASYSVMSQETDLTRLPDTWTPGRRFQDGPLSLFGTD